MTTEKCKHESFTWRLKPCDETGWTCLDCNKPLPGEPPGFRPDLDRSNTSDKVGGILMDLHMGEFIYMSNNTAGDGLTAAVVAECKRTGFYDQASILLFVLQIDAASDGPFWKNISEGILAGKDPRDRCWCGKLSELSDSNGKFCSLAHSGNFQERVRKTRARVQGNPIPEFEPEHLKAKPRGRQSALDFWESGTELKG